MQRRIRDKSRKNQVRPLKIVEKTDVEKKRDLGVFLCFTSCFALREKKMPKSLFFLFQRFYVFVFLFKGMVHEKYNLSYKAYQADLTGR